MTKISFRSEQRVSCGPDAPHLVVVPPSGSPVVRDLDVDPEQTQTATMSLGVTRHLSCTQTQTATLIADPTLTAHRSVSANQTQTASIATQTIAPTVQYPLTLSAVQRQTPKVSRTTRKTLRFTQGHVASISRQLAKTVPDRRNNPDPNLVIDPTLVKDSTAGLQTFINSTPTGSVIVLPFDLQINGQVILSGGRTLQGTNVALRRTVGYAWRPTGGLAAQFQYDAQGGQANEPTSLQNPYWYPNAQGQPNNGADWGGYSGTTGQSGVDYDGLHLTDRYSAPFNSSHVGKAIQVVINANLGTYYNKIVTAVSSDGKTAYFNNTDNTSQHNDTGGTCAWCITSKGKTWTAVFLPNPSWKPQSFNGGNSPWQGYVDCLNACQNNNVVATVRVDDTSVLKGIEVVGANAAWRNCITAFDKSSPVANEFQHCVQTTASTAKVIDCNLHHAWGDCEHGHGQVLNTYMGQTGRQGCTGHWNNKVIDGCTIEGTHHSTIDIEMPGGSAASNVQITNNCFGGPHGMAWQSPVNGLTFQGNHSTQADIDSGRISSLARYSRIHNWGGGGSDVLVDSCTFDLNTGNNQSDPAYEIHNVSRLTVTNNKTPTTDFFLHAPGCTSVSSHDNDGGPNCLGQLG